MQWQVSHFVTLFLLTRKVGTPTVKQTTEIPSILFSDFTPIKTLLKFTHKLKFSPKFSLLLIWKCNNLAKKILLKIHKSPDKKDPTLPLLFISFNNYFPCFECFIFLKHISLDIHPVNMPLSSLYHCTVLWQNIFTFTTVFMFHNPTEISIFPVFYHHYAITWHKRDDNLHFLKP